MERTLAMIKPDAIGVCARVVGAFKRCGLEVVAEKLLFLSFPQAVSFYEEHKGKDFFIGLCHFMVSGPVLVMVLEGEDAVQRWRQIIGHTDPAKAEEGTLRKRFGTEMPRNAVHGSASIEDAKREISFFFAQCELIRAWE